MEPVRGCDICSKEFTGKNANKILSRHKVKVHHVHERKIYKSSVLRAETDTCENVDEIVVAGASAATVEKIVETTIATDCDEGLNEILDFLHDELDVVSGPGEAETLELNESFGNDLYIPGELIPLDGSVDYWTWSDAEEEGAVSSDAYTEEDVAEAVRLARVDVLMGSSEDALSALEKRFRKLPVVMLKGIVKAFERPEGKPVEIVEPLAAVINVSDDEEEDDDDISFETDVGEIDISLESDGDDVYRELVNMGLMEE